MPWLTNEDLALKMMLQGLTVSDANSPSRRVPVRYRSPEVEVSDLTFPIIIITHDYWSPAPERMHDGYTTLPYAPEGFNPWFADTGPGSTLFDPNDSPYYTQTFPIAYNFDYYVTLYTRFMHEHMMPLVSALSQFGRLHPKYGFLDIPQDGTKRTLQVLDGPHPSDGKDVNDKRLFWTDWKIRVFSELVPSIIQPTIATMVNLDLSVYSDTEDLTIGGIQEAKGLLSVGSSVAWNVA